MTALLTAVLVSVSWDVQFDRYIRSNLESVAQSWAQVFASGYQQTGTWEGGWLANVPRFGMMRGGIGLELLDQNGRVLMQDLGFQRYLTGGPGQLQQPEGPVVETPVLVDNQIVGTVRVWSPSTGRLQSDIDERFRRAALWALGTAALLAVALATAVGVWYARRVTRPILRITETAQALRSGNEHARTNMVGEDEVGLLAKTFDEMADAIEADRELERRLTGDVAHELRTPLQAIQATVEAMQDGVLPADPERLEVVRNETVRLGRLADGILELTRLERGSVPFSMQRIDVATPVRAAADTHRALMESLDLVMTVDIVEGLHVMGDDERLRQALGNLLSNAARYTPEGGRVEVSVRKETDQAVITVADTGIGIAEQDLPRVFSRFWRADEARSRATGGLGIGLSVVKEIVERHHGTIGARRRDGDGSVFSIRLPLA